MMGNCVVSFGVVGVSPVGESPIIGRNGKRFVAALAALLCALASTAIAQKALPADRDQDGFPDAWEAARPGMNPDRPNTLQDAFNAAADHDTVTLMPGEYPTNNLDGKGKSLMLTSVDPESQEVVIKTVLRGNGRAPILSPSAMTTGGRLEVAGLSFTGGRPAISLNGATDGKGQPPELVLRNNRFIENQGDEGGAIAADTATLILIRNTFIGNQARNGAAVRLSGQLSLVSENNLVANGVAAGDGGGYYLNGTGIFSSRNDTFAGNRAGNSGGAVFTGMGLQTALIRNGIYWGNTAPSGSQIAVDKQTVLALEFSDVQNAFTGGITGDETLTHRMFAGGGNISQDPRFAGLDDWHVASSGGRPTGNGHWVTDAVSSPCLDAGGPADEFALEPSPNGGRINLGCYGNTGNASKTPLPALVIPWLKAQLVEGGRLCIPVRLSTPPAQPMTIQARLDSVADAQLSVENATLVFSAANWAQPQTVTVVAAKDANAANGAASLSLTGLPGAATVIALEEIDLDNPAVPGCLTDAGERFGEAVIPQPEGLVLPYTCQAPPQVQLAVLDVDGKPWPNATIERSGSIVRIRIPDAAEGSLIFSVRLRDGQRIQDQTVAVQVDAVPPLVEFSPKAVAGKPASQTVVVAASDPGATVFVTTDGNVPHEAASQTTSGTSPLTLTVTENAPIQAVAIDAAGNRSAVQTTLLAAMAVGTSLANFQVSYNSTSQTVGLAWTESPGATGSYRLYRAVGAYESRLLQDCASRGIGLPASLKVAAPTISRQANGACSTTDALPPFGATAWYAIAKTEGDVISSSATVSLNVPNATAATAVAGEARRRAKEWLLATQAATGAWAPTSTSMSATARARLRLLTTCQVLRGLQKQACVSTPAETPRAGVWNGLGFIQGQWPDNIRLAAEKTLTLAAFSLPVERADGLNLLAAALYTGTNVSGWGVQSKLAPDAINTALAKKALLTFSPTLAWTEETNIFYKTVSTSTDRYGWQPGGAASVLVSAVAYGVTQASPSTCAWVLSLQQANGSIGASIVDTAAALVWLPTGAWPTTPSNKRDAARTWLLQQQTGNGSWNNDPYLTGLCLDAISYLP